MMTAQIQQKQFRSHQVHHFQLRIYMLSITGNSLFRYNSDSNRIQPFVPMMILGIHSLVSLLTVQLILILLYF